MSLAKNFCSSPWFHIRINNAGGHEHCRWASKTEQQQQSSIANEDPITFFQKGMSALRSQLLNGESPDLCRECYLQDTHSKVSGRQRQLLKVGVDLDNFDKTLLSSPWVETFSDSNDNQGTTDLYPQDWQIDLGNFCNSGCIFCNPFSSSWIANEYKRVGLIDQVLAASWAENLAHLDKFIDALTQSKKLTYLQFIGGETLITPAFKKILQELINRGLHKELTIGFTTNLTIWRQDIVDLLVHFKSVNLGASVECFHPVNDYLRYGSNLQTVTDLLGQWITVANQLNWSKALRITPTLFSIMHLDTIYQYAQENRLSVESCNFLNEPAYLRPSVLPPDMRQLAIDKLQKWINQSPGTTTVKVTNVRDLTVVDNQLVQDATSYIRYLSCQDYETHRLPELVKFLKVIEQSRKNSILTYLPEYENILRTAGY